MKGVIFLIFILINSCKLNDPYIGIEVIRDYSIVKKESLYCEGRDSLVVFKLSNMMADSIVIDRPNHIGGDCYFPTTILYFKKRIDGKLVNDGLTSFDQVGIPKRDTLAPYGSLYFVEDTRFFNDSFKRAPCIMLRYPYEKLGDVEGYTFEVLLCYDDKKNEIKLADKSLIVDK